MVHSQLIGGVCMVCGRKRGPSAGNPSVQVNKRLETTPCLMQDQMDLSCKRESLHRQTDKERDREGENERGIGEGETDRQTENTCNFRDYNVYCPSYV